MVAVDSDNRILVLLNATTTKEHTFIIYNLDDYISNKNNAKVISEFKVVNNKDNISRQGIDVYGNYIYSYEGNVSNAEKKEHVVYLSVHSLNGETIAYRTPINYPDNNVWFFGIPELGGIIFRLLILHNSGSISWDAIMPTVGTMHMELIE